MLMAVLQALRKPKSANFNRLTSGRFFPRTFAHDVLIRYPLPGNGLEVADLVERLDHVCPEGRIEPHHLPSDLFRGAAERPHHPYSTLHEARSAYEREFILRKLQEHRWNMTQTATALGLERSHLYRKMKSLVIAAPD